MQPMTYRETCDALSERFAPILWPIILILSATCFGLITWIFIMLVELTK